MANYQDNVAVNQTLAANTADTVTLSSTIRGKIRIINETGTNPIYVTEGEVKSQITTDQHDRESTSLSVTNPPAPTVGGADEYEVPAQAGAQIELDCSTSGAVVSLISAGAMAYSVVSADAEEEVIT